MNTEHHVIYRKAVPGDYQGILKLQKENLIHMLDESAAKDGFLSIELSEAQFDEINRDLGVVVAVRRSEIIGYLCGSSCAYNMRFPILQRMISKIPEIVFDGVRLTTENAFVYGPVCIARSVRGAGILEGLYEALKTIAKPGYSFCVLFVSGKNPRSLHAHKNKLGMRELSTFEFNGSLFYILGSAI